MALSKPSSNSPSPPLQSQSEFAPLSAADFNSSSFLTDILGLSPSSNASRGSTAVNRGVVKTYQCGEFKYPDVTSPLNKILCKTRFIRDSGLDGEVARSLNSFQSFRDGDRSVFSTPDSGLYQQYYRNSFETDENSHAHADEVFPLPIRSPSTFTPQSTNLTNLGFTSGDVGTLASKPVELTRNLSPQSDVGYGTSFDSTESRGQTMRRDIDIDGLSELLRNISMNTSTMKIPGSPIVDSNSIGSSSLINNNNGSSNLSNNAPSFCGDNLNVLPTSGLTYFDPAVAQAAIEAIPHHHSHAQQQEQLAFQNLQTLQNLQSLQQCMNNGGSGAGRSSSLLDSQDPPNHFYDNQFTPGRGFSKQEFQSRGCGGQSCGASSPFPDELEVEMNARIHRNSAGWQFSGGPGRAIHAAVNIATCTWSGQLPSRSHTSSPLSCKIFLGGVPWDISEQALMIAFKPFGNIRVEWPAREITSSPKGYLYIIFENEKQVRCLLNACTHDYGQGGSWYFKISSRKSRNEEVQVIPWVIADSSCMRGPSQQIDPKKTVFVGALHGTLNAEGLCNIFNDLFGGVVFASVDTDKHKYPIGSGRVTFNNHKSYMKALAAAFIEIRTQKFSKKVQVDPYLEDALCSSCSLRQGPYFCRDFICFKYFCHTCWEMIHSSDGMKQHKTLMRNPRPNLMSKNSFPMGGINGFGFNLGIQNHFD